MRRAFSQLRMGRPSPVLLDLPSDILRGELPGAEADYIPVRKRRSGGDPQDVRDAAKVLLGAENPVIHAGQGVLYAEAWDELRELAELTQTPVMTSMAGKSAFREDHPLSLGARSSTTTGMVVQFLKQADVVFGIGCSFTRMHYGADAFDSKVLVHITNDENDLNKDYSPDVAVIGDAKLVMRQLIAEVKAMLADAGSERVDRGDVAGSIKAVRDEWMKEWLPKMHSDAVPINPYRALNDLSKAIDHKQTIMNHDSGKPARPDDSFLQDRYAARLHRMGQVNAAGLQPGGGYGQQARRSGQIMCECNRRLRFRYGWNRPRNGCP